jgi:hypothetical protein
MGYNSKPSVIFTDPFLAIFIWQGQGMPCPCSLTFNLHVKVSKKLTGSGFYFN